MKNKTNSFEIVIYGAGAIGASIGGWLTPRYNKISLLVRGDNAKIMKSKGLILYHKINNNPKPISVKIIRDLNEKPSVNVIIITVKNYDLEEAAKDIFSKLGDNAVIVALQNGADNQKILPKYFSKVIYGIVVFSAWRDEPGIFGYRDKGQLILGTLDEKFQPIARKVKDILNLALPTTLTQNLQDAVHSKLILNLGNAIFTLINSETINKSSLTILRKISTNTLNEGIKVVQAAGYKQYKLKGVPSWKIFSVVDKVPKKIADTMFKNTIKGTLHNSMIQDIVMRGKNQSELDSFNGYIINLAESLGIDVPFNKTIFELCKKQFKTAPFKPLDAEFVWEEISRRIKLSK